MRLELRWSQVETLTAGTTTRMAGKALEVSLDELRARLEDDARLQRIRLDLAHPGEACRIGRVFDVMAPRAKVEGGEDFPGVLGRLGRAGRGRTLALGNVAVVVTDQPLQNPGGACADRHVRAGRRLDGVRPDA